MQPKDWTNEEWLKQDYFDGLEKEWRESMREIKNYTEMEWLKIFPECAPMLKRGLRTRIQELEEVLLHNLEGSENLKREYISVPRNDHWLLDSRMEQLNAFHKEVSQELRSKEYLLKRLNGEIEKNVNSVEREDIIEAKKVDLVNLISAGRPIKKVNGRFVCLCPFHEEKHGSFTVYSNNTWYCFGACNEGGDVIDFMCKLYDMKFLEAVRWLIKK